jgi:DegV family protein with EDD domain
MRRVKIVTDSTADIPEELVEELDISVIHDYINFGTQSLRDKVDISRAEFYSRLAVDQDLPTTAAPGVGEFEEIYRKAGALETAIVSLHHPPDLARSITPLYWRHRRFLLGG